MDSVICTSCLLGKPQSEFGDRARGKKCRQCKQCVAAQSRASYERNRKKKLSQNRRWYYENREARLKQTAEYQRTHPEVTARAGKKYREANRQKVAAYRRQYLEKNRARFNEWRRASRKQNAERQRVSFHKWRATAAGAGSSFTLAEWLALLEACNWSCVACGVHVSEIKAIYPGRDLVLEVDHITPLSIGGSGDISNIQPLCQACNNKKRKKVIDYRPAEVRLAFSLKAA